MLMNQNCKLWVESWSSFSNKGSLWKSTYPSNQQQTLNFCQNYGCVSGHRVVMAYCTIQKHCRKKSKHKTKQDIREALLSVLDLKKGSGSGKKTCLGGGLDMIHWIQFFLNPLCREMEQDWGVSHGKANEVETHIENLLNQYQSIFR